MNLILLHPDDFVDTNTAYLTGRRLEHVLTVHRATVGKKLKVGLIGGHMGDGHVLQISQTEIVLSVSLIEPPPPKWPITLILALPRPKVLNRVIASATSLGVARIVLINAWKVEKAYWKSPRLTEDNLLHQRLLGLEQACDTILPELVLARLFSPFMSQTLPFLIEGATKLLAHPSAITSFPRGFHQPLAVAIGPEGGWIEAEEASFERAGFRPVSLGSRILRTETAVAHIMGRLF